MRRWGNRNGMILVFSLWVLGILTILAVSVAAGIRQKILLVQHVDGRSRLANVTQSAVKKTVNYIKQQMELAGFEYSPILKMNLHNNGGVLQVIKVGEDEAEVGYAREDINQGALNYGVVDEERKINLNKTNKLVLKDLVSRVLGMKEPEARQLAEALLDWRQYGESQATGFFSDEYYAHLQYPYPKKDADYETLEEMLLVKGMNSAYFAALNHFVTVYGDGQVNINTAPAHVLAALGFEDPLIEKIMVVRRGKDGIEGTGDDHVFLKSFDVASDVNAHLKLDPNEVQVIDAVNTQGALTTRSTFFSINVVGRLAHGQGVKNIKAIFSAREQKIVYWKEK